MISNLSVNASDCRWCALQNKRIKIRVINRNGTVPKPESIKEIAWNHHISIYFLAFGHLGKWTLIFILKTTIVWLLKLKVYVWSKRWRSTASEHLGYFVEPIHFALIQERLAHSSQLESWNRRWTNHEISPEITQQ